MKDVYINTAPPKELPLSEAAVTNKIKLEASTKGIYLWRNNVGAVYSQDEKRFIRFGLANESKQMNETIKSGDLIGIRPIMITQDMVGATIGQFVSVEAKRSDWRFTGTDREIAQKNWVDLINNNGGYATFATGEGFL